MRGNLIKEQNLATVVFLSIPIILFLVFYIFPIAFTIYLSFHKWDGLMPKMLPVGFKNYVSIFKSSHFRVAFSNNAKWLLFYILIPPAIGLGLALLVNTGVKGDGIFSTIFFLPNAISAIAVASVWRWLYTPGHGLFNEILRSIKPEFVQNWLGNPKLSTYSVMAAATWMGVGFCYVIYRAGLKSIPPSLIEAANIDGASFGQSFRYIIWPCLAPSTVVVVAISALWGILIFDLVFALTGGKPAYYSSVLALFMYEASFNYFQMGKGAAIAIVLFLLAALIISPYLFYSMRKIENVRK